MNLYNSVPFFTQTTDLLPTIYSQVGTQDLAALNRVCRLMHEMVLDDTHNRQWIQGRNTLTTRQIKEYQDRTRLSGRIISFAESLKECLTKAKTITDVHLNDEILSQDVVQALLDSGSSVEKLYLKNMKCSAVNFAQGASFALKSMKRLSLIDIQDSQLAGLTVDLRDIESLTTVAIESSYLTSGQSLAGCKKLERVLWKDCAELSFPPTFKGCVALKTIEMIDCENMRVPPDLSHLPSLQSVVLQNCRQLKRAPRVDGCNQLQEYCLRDCFRIELGPDLRNLPELRSVEVYGGAHMLIPPLVIGCLKLREYIIHGSERMSMALDLRHLPALVRVSVKKMNQLATGPYIEGSKNLESYLVKKCPRVLQVADMIDMPRLLTYRVVDCPLVNQAPKIVACPKLLRVNMKRCNIPLP